MCLNILKGVYNYEYIKSECLQETKRMIYKIKYHCLKNSVWSLIQP